MSKLECTLDSHCPGNDEICDNFVCRKTGEGDPCGPSVNSKTCSLPNHVCSEKVHRCYAPEDIQKNSIQGIKCDNDNRCKPGDYCKGIGYFWNGSCAPRKNMFETCKGHEDCAYPYNCIEGVCLLPCINDGDCSFLERSCMTSNESEKNFLHGYCCAAGDFPASSTFNFTNLVNIPGIKKQYDTSSSFLDAILSKSTAPLALTSPPESLPTPSQTQAKTEPITITMIEKSKQDVADTKSVEESPVEAPKQPPVNVTTVEQPLPIQIIVPIPPVETAIKDQVNVPPPTKTAVKDQPIVSAPPPQATVKPQSETLAPTSQPVVKDQPVPPPQPTVKSQTEPPPQATVKSQMEPPLQATVKEQPVPPPQATVKSQTEPLAPPTKKVVKEQPVSSGPPPQAAVRSQTGPVAPFPVKTPVKDQSPPSTLTAEEPQFQTASTGSAPPKTGTSTLGGGTPTQAKDTKSGTDLTFVYVVVPLVLVLIIVAFFGIRARNRAQRKRNLKNESSHTDLVYRSSTHGGSLRH